MDADADAGEETSADSGASGLIRHAFVAVALFTPALIVGYLRHQRDDGNRSER
jgi:hypothetical protein